MFSVSSAEFAGLPGFIEKVSNVTVDTESGDFSAQMDELRNWSAEQGMSVHYSKTPSGVYYTLKYDRAKLTDEQYSSIGRFRSVVFDNKGKVCCIAPPKMLKLTDTLSSVAVNSAGGYLHAEEFVEGVMFNLFYHSDKWFVATKSCVGEVSYDHMKDAPISSTTTQSNDTDAATTGTAYATPAFQKLPVQEILRRRICDTLSLLTNGLEATPKQYCYSFVLQHPKNQIVAEVTVPKLYLIAVFELSVLNDATHAIRLERDIFSTSFTGSVFHMPTGLTCVADSTDDTSATLTPHTVADYCKMYGSQETRGATLPGVVFRDSDTGFCYKQRNPKYESVKKRKGMEQKLLSQYLYLRKERGIDEYLKYHPQHNKIFNDFRERLHEYTLRLYTSYIDHYVKKDNKPLKEYERELKTHMYKLHYDVFLATMKDTGSFITKHSVINYVNNLAPAQQLACLNLVTSVSVSGTTVSESTSRFDQPKSMNSPAHTRDYHGVRGGGGRGGGGRGGGRGGSTLAERGGFRTSRGNSAPQSSVVQPEKAVSRQSSSSRGGKSSMSGLVKVQNQFSSLESDHSSSGGGDHTEQ
jgi:hypothetical protein